MKKRQDKKKTQLETNSTILSGTRAFLIQPSIMASKKKKKNEMESLVIKCTDLMGIITLALLADTQYFGRKEKFNLA